MTKRILITSALPYANGPIHIGHLVEYIQTDIFVRFLKLLGLKAIYCCADDTHGAPISIKAQQLGIKPEELIKRFYDEHTKDFKGFQITFDSYYSTNSKENKEFSDHIFNKAKQKGFIYKKEVEQTYCEKCKRFLPDRYVKGTCPKCGAEDQYGDVCEKCNAAYKTIDLIDPYCAICRSTPVRKTSEHYFFKLSAFTDKLKSYIKEKRFQEEIKNHLFQWLENLEDWDITRDAPYFGFNIPGEKDKYYYVWLDAPIGYISSTANYCKKHGGKTEDYWKSKDAKIIHFIGKDIIYFHFLFWPAMLMASDFNLPEDIVVHGFLTVSKEKMSKSRGTFLTAKEYLKILEPSYLRYYYAANLTHKTEDINLDFDDLKSRVNNELVANIANFCYRVLSFTNKNFNSEIKEVKEKDLAKKITNKFKDVEDAYNSYDFRRAVKTILEISDIGNQYFQKNEPWKLIKTDKEKTHEIVSFCVNLVKDLAILTKPILPVFSEQLEKQLNLKDPKWKDLNFDLKKHKINKAEILVNKIEKIELGKDPFSALDLRVAKITDVKNHPEADNLFVLDINLGTEKRTLVAGLKEFYKKEDLAGKNIVVVCNLKPAKLRGIESRGMLLAAEKEKHVKLLLAEKSKPGDTVFVEGIASEPKKELDIKEFSAIKIAVKNKQALYSGKPLKTAREAVLAEIEDGAVVR